MSTPPSHSPVAVVSCDGLRCRASARGPIARLVRRYLKRKGWAVDVPNPDASSRIRRLDFCPSCKPEEAGHA